MCRTPGRVQYDVIAAKVGEILYYIWDPIGVAGVPEARDEYDGYVPQVVRMLIDGKGKEEIARYLCGIEGENMGLSVGSASRDHAHKVAAALIRNHEWLETQG
jgi:hypothetical protein